MALDVNMCRVDIVPPENRYSTIIPTTRCLSVPTNDRTSTINKEIRALAVPANDRIITATCV